MDSQLFYKKILSRESTKKVAVKRMKECYLRNRRAMHKAVEKHDINMVEILLNNGINVDIRDKNTGYTPLHKAIKLNNHLLAYTLLTKGADINKITKSGATSLHIAIYETGDEEMVFLTIHHGVNINTKRFDKSPLHLATEMKMFNVVEVLLEKGCNVNDVTSIGKTALHIAVETKNPEIVDLLLNYGARYDLKIWGKCPLSLAVSNGSYEIVLILLNKMVSKIFYCRNVHTAMYLAFEQKNKDIAYAFMKYHINPNWRLGPKSILHFAVEYQWENMVKLLLEKGADVSFVASNNTSVLHTALKVNNSSIVKILLEFGVNVNIQLDYSSDTPLHLAVRNNCLVSICSLLEKGADPNMMNSHECTPLQLAFDLHHRNIIYYLLKFDVNLMAHKCGKSLLEIAVDCQWLDLTAHLLREGADVNITVGENVSLLVMAIKQNNIDMMQLLLKYGADIHAVDQKYNMTPLLFATAQASVATTEFLLKRGADINYSTPQGITALMLAMAKQRDEDMIILLLKHGAVTDVGGLSKQLILSTAVEQDWLEIAKMMIARGAEVNQCSRSLFKSLDRSIRTGTTYLSSILAKYATDVWKKSIFSHTLIYIAASYSSVEMVELMLKHGATVNSLNFNELSPLFAALRRKNERIFNALIERGYCINAKEPESEQTPLHVAAIYGCTKEVSMMLARGAEVEAIDIYEKTPLYYAVQFSHIEITKLLLTHDGRSAAWRENLYNSLVCAVSLRNLKMVPLLLSKNPPLTYYEESDKTALGVAACEKMDYNILRLLLDYDLYDSKKKLNAEDILCHVDHGANSTPVVAECLIQHMVRRQFTVDVGDWEVNSIPKKIQDYYEKCLEEVEEMREDTFYNKVSFYTILNRHPKRLAIMLRNDMIREKFYKSNYEVNYPIFKDTLKCCIDKSVTIAKRTVAAEAALKLLTKRSLPHYVMQRIFSFLSDADTQILLEATLQDYEAWPANKEMHEDII